MRFPEFTGEWEEKRLGEVAEHIKERISSSLLSTKSYISTENMAQGFQGVTPASSIPSGINVVSYKTDDILLSNIRPYLKKMWKATWDGGCSSDVFVFRSKETYSPCFLYYSVANDNFINYVMSGAKGVKMPRGDRQQIQQFSVHVPSKSEQDKIATFLSLLDQRIATQSKIIEEMKKMKAALVERLFYSKENSLYLRFPGFKTEWRKTTLGDITCNFSRRNKDRIAYPMYSVTNNQGFVPQSEKFGDREMVGEDICSYKIIERGDFAYNPARINVGSIARYDESTPCMISSLYVCFRLKDTIDSNWAFHLLKSKRINFYYDVYGEGGVRVYLFYPNFSRIKVSVPDIQEQKRIGKFLTVIERNIDLETKIASKYQTQKAYLLKHMFT